MTTQAVPECAVRGREHGPLRVAVIGCGAITRDFHLPVLAGHERIRLAGLVDRDLARAAELATAYGVDSVLNDAAELKAGQVDAALIATPPFHHAACTIELVRRGIHVLVEKPMALSLADARAMVAAAEDAGVVLAVGLFRRLFPSLRLLRSLADSRLLGRPVGFDFEAGSIYGWALTTLANMRKDQGGGGVFIDMAPHLLDQLLFVLPGEPEILEYRDNARGGIESDCLLRLRLHHDGAAIDGRVELSRTRKLRNTMRIECERGILEIASGERFQVSVRPHGLELTDPVCERARPYQLHAEWADEARTLGYAAYRAEIDDWVDAIQLGRKPTLDGASALPVVALIEHCYRNAGRLAEPWVDGGLQPPPVANGARETVPAEPRGGRRGRVLVTGATGFVGCRVAEILRLRDGWDVRGLVRNAANATRLSRLPVDMVLGDLQSEADIARAVAGCDAVVHCAIGTAWGRRREIFDVTVGGTRRLAEAALAAGVRRFVHVSTVAIHGKHVRGTLDESTPVQPPRGDDYSESKAEAERAIATLVRKGLPAVTLRLANVYGPFSSILMSRPIPSLVRGDLVVLDGHRKSANMVYIDNVAEAIVRALEAPADAAVGEAFAISDGDSMTWTEFYGFFARAFGVPPPATAGAPATEQPMRRGLLRWAFSWLNGCKTVLTSAEVKAVARLYLQTDPVGTLPRTLLERCPWLERRLRKLFKLDRPLIYDCASSQRAPERGGRMVLNPIDAFVSPAKARRQLGLAPAVPTARALELTLAWLDHARLVDRRLVDQSIPEGERIVQA